MNGKPMDEAYLKKVVEDFSNRPEMNVRFYRVYHLKNGEAVEMGGSPHLTYDDAVKHLWFFHPSDVQGADDMASVKYVTIEKRFYPTPYKQD